MALTIHHDLFLELAPWKIEGKIFMHEWMNWFIRFISTLSFESSRQEAYSSLLNSTLSDPPPGPNQERVGWYKLSQVTLWAIMAEDEKEAGCPPFYSFQPNELFGGNHVKRFRTLSACLPASRNTLPKRTEWNQTWTKGKNQQKKD